MILICNLWSSANVKWSDANWSFSERELIREICEIWGTSGVKFGDANWTWGNPECGIPIPPIPPIPVVTIGNSPGVDATTLVQPWMIDTQPWNPYQTSSLDKQRRLIKLICKVKNMEYNEEKEIKDFKVTVGDIRMIVKTIMDIDLQLKLEE